MTSIVRRHIQHFDRWSSALLFLGLGHLALARFGFAGLMIAAALVFVSACFRAWMFHLDVRTAG